MPDFLSELDRLPEFDEGERPALIHGILSNANRYYTGRDLTDLHLIKGYAAYHFPDLVQNTIDVEEELCAVLVERPFDITARFYLACHHFDVGEYQNAFAHFSMIEDSQYLSFGQIWRAIKLGELKLCCEIGLGRFKNVLAMLNVLVDRVVATSEDNTPVPTELVRVFEEFGNEICPAIGVDDFRQCLLLLQEYIVHSGSASVFRERLDRLFSRLSQQ